MRFLRTNTAIRLTVGPFFDKTDGVTPETALTVTNCKLTFMVDDGNVPTLVLDTNPTGSGGANDMIHVTGDDAGFYDLELAAANVNYLGRAMLALTDAANHCPVFHEFMILPAMVYDSLVLGTDRFDANVTHVADSSQTAGDIIGDTNDIQARLPAALTSGGRMKASVEAILDSSFTEGAAGRIAAAFKQFFNIATPAATMDHGVLVDTVTTLTNAPSDSSGVTTLLTRLSALRAGYLDNLSAGAAALESSLQGLITTVGAAGAGLTATASAVWSVATRLLTAGTNIVLAKGVGVTGFNDLSAAQVNTEADTALADVGVTSTVTGRIDAAMTTRASQISVDTIDDFVDLEVAAIKAKTDQLTFTTANKVDARAFAVDDKTGYALTSGERTAIANEVEAQIIDETDSEKVLTAITDKIASVNPSLGDLTLAAIASQVRTELATELARIDVAISSRSTYAGADTAGTTTLLARLTSTRAGLLDNLDATITSRLAAAGYTAPSNATIAQIYAAVDTEVAAILAAVDTEITAIKAKTDKLTFDGDNVIASNVKKVNDVDLTGDGSSTPWGPA